MPEGPEVSVLVQGLHSRYLSEDRARWNLVDASILSGRYHNSEEQFRSSNFEMLKLNLPMRLDCISCKGKFIWFTFTKFPPSLEQFNVWSTLGMTGGWSLYPHPHARIAFRLRQRGENGEDTTLYFYDMRNFGTFKVSSDHKILSQRLQKLGRAWLGMGPIVEGWQGLMTWPEFSVIAAASVRRAPLRPLCVFLMDQSKTAGIGNYILSEILFATGTSPWALIGDVEEQRWRNIFHHARRIIYSSFVAQIAAKGLAIKDMAIENGKIHTLEPAGFQLQVYGRQQTPPQAFAGGQKFHVVRAEGPHKRTVHFVPSIQTGASPLTSCGDLEFEGDRTFVRMSVSELKSACRERGLPISGCKAELKARIEKHDGAS